MTNSHASCPRTAHPRLVAAAILASMLSPAVAVADGDDFDRYIADLGTATPQDSLAFVREIFPDLKKTEATMPGLAGSISRRA